MKAVASVTHQVNFRSRAGAAEPAPPTPARVTRLLALAHQVQHRINGGEFRDLADAARALNVSRARVTQLMSLLLLAPEIQEAILDLPPVSGRDSITERQLRAICAEPLWEEQVRMWRRLQRRMQ